MERKKLTEKIEESFKKAEMRTVTQEELGDIMDQAVRTLLDAEEQIDDKLELKKKKKYKQGWSIEFMNKLKVLTKCKTMFTHAKKNRLWESSKMAEIINLKYAEWINVEPPPAVTAGKEQWER